MTQTVTGAVAVRQKQDQVIDWIRTQQSEIAMVAATHVKPSAIVRVAHGALRRNDKLMAAAIANPQSLLYALLDAARLGHEPDTDDYYLVPFGSEVTGIEGYKGIIDRMYRAGGVSSVVAQVVRQTDRYAPQGENTPPVHEYDDFASPADRGALRGAYAYAIFPGGRCSQVIRMGRAEIMEHKAKSRGSHKDDSPWQQWEAAMWKKTVLRALEPYVPTSTEYRTAAGILTAAGAAELSARAGMPGALQSGHPVPASADHAPDVVDAEIVDEPYTEPGPATAPPAGASAHTSGPANGQPARPAAARGTSKAAQAKLEDLMRRIPLGEAEDREVFVAWVTGHPAAETLTSADVRALTTTLEDALQAAEGDTAEAASQLWQQHKNATGGGDE
jgi:recombination protein RecT